MLAGAMAEGRISYPFLKATPFLEAVGDLAVAWCLLWGAVLANDKFEALAREKGVGEDPAQRATFIDDNAEAAFLAGKVHSARFFIGNVLPVTDGKLDAVMWGDQAAWEITERSFGL